MDEDDIVYYTDHAKEMLAAIGQIKVEFPLPNGQSWFGTINELCRDIYRKHIALHQSAELLVEANRIMSDMSMQIKADEAALTTAKELLRRD